MHIVTTAAPRLAKAVRRIGRDALLNCTSLGELHTPPNLLFIDKRAFAGCTQLCKLIRMGRKTTWRGTYAVHDAFESCMQLALPTWIRLLPKPTDGHEEWADSAQKQTAEKPDHADLRQLAGYRQTTHLPIDLPVLLPTLSR